MELPSLRRAVPYTSGPKGATTGPAPTRQCNACGYEQPVSALTNVANDVNVCDDFHACVARFKN